ncbi:FHA domain-containing protein [Streptomyces sp. NPDC048566]|uniref:FHA domain-containing protein n=1 Tax=Streptomyces sp. NPDC048566 TaxID=3365569 RepID=UPI00371BA3F2
MQIRLTVVDPSGPASEPRGRATACDVLVTAPAGTALAAVASGLASAVGAGGSGGQGERGREPGGAQIVLYAGPERLDAQRCTLGEPPLTDGAVLGLGSPVEPGPDPDDVAARLHVVAGPDAGGVHLLHEGRVHVGRSAEADVPLDDPDVSRLHCAVTVAPDGRVSVADTGSTNGTTVDGSRVGSRPVRLAEGALLRVGESALRLAPPVGPAPMPTAPDGEGHVRVPVAAPETAHGPRDEAGAPSLLPPGGIPDPRQPRGAVPHARGESAALFRAGPPAPADETHHAYGTGGWGASAGAVPGAAGHGRTAPVVPEQGGPPPAETGPHPASGGGSAHRTARPEGPEGHAGTAAPRPPAAPDGDPGGDPGVPTGGSGLPPAPRRRGGLGAWARRLAGSRGGPEADPYETDDDGALPAGDPLPPAVHRSPETWPDPATLLLTALGPGPRLWERGPGHPEALAVRLGTADRTAPDGSGPLPAVPVTAGLREVGSLGLAGPRARLAGLARAVVAQLAALHSPDALEIVLISADRARPVQERCTEWSWLGWLPHLRPAHGQDCRLLLAYDREQAAARADELLRRLEDRLAEPEDGPGVRAPRAGHEGGAVPAARNGEHADTGRADGTNPRGAAHRPSWADAGSDSAAGRPGAAPGHHPDAPLDGPYTVLVVDGDPGGADVRMAVTRLAREGARAGVHVVCLAETPAASPASPVAETYEAACAVAPAFRACGAVALLSGDVATALRLLRVAPGGAGGSAPGGTPPAAAPQGAPARTRTASAAGGRDDGATHLGIPHPAAGRGARSSGAAVPPAGGTAGPGGQPPRGPVGHGTVAVVDAVSLAWAERFARALAPLRTDAGHGEGERPARVSAPLPRTARLLDELGLARATPASLMARWADAGDDTEALGGRARAVLGAGPRGPVVVDLHVEGPHLLVEGPAGSGRTELLRSVTASLAAAERPDRLGIVLMEGRDGTGGPGAGGSGEGLRACTDLPHVTTHLTANDPVRMREFAQSLSAELKRRSELLGRLGFGEWHTGRAVSGRLVAQRSPAPAPGGAASSGAADLDSSSSSTLRLRPAAARRQAEQSPPPARLVVVVDDLDALLSPPLGSPGRPAAGSVVRALEAVAREGDRLGVHLVAASAADGRTAGWEPARSAALRVTLDVPAPGPEEPAPGRGRLRRPDGRETPFQGGRVTGRIPRTATLRPTVVPLEWQRMGDPPTRRPVRELGNGPTDLALLASALERAARSVSATEVPSLL